MLHAREDYARIQDPAGKIGEDEPVFLIRATDIVAADVVHHWAILNHEAGGDEELSNLALEHARRIRVWQARNGCKPADL
jgi:hypothetical protein